jgi:hypothetical protein
VGRFSLVVALLGAVLEVAGFVDAQRGIEVGKVFGDVLT